ncbi:MAG: signal peptidase I [Clostridiales bacterium]|nr:signal peptidase I [Clostridiales bacterium]
MENDLQQLNNEGEAVADTKTKNKRLSKFIDIFLWVLIAALVLAVIFRAFIFTQITVSGESMMTTFHDREVVGVSKVKHPERGDVVIFYKEDGSNKFLDIFGSGKSGDDNEHTKLIKRVVALAGDKLWVEAVDGFDNLYKVVIQTLEGDVIYEDSYVRNGETLSAEDFYIKKIVSNGSDLGILAQHIGKENALEIPENCFFAMGDNRSNSSDSRAFGAVPLSRLYGVVIGA